VKLVVLAAGYATRLYPLTLDRPKHLLEVAGRPILDHVLDAVEPIGFDGIHVVTNAKFADAFRSWADNRDVTVVDDGTDTEDTRLGAIGDLELVIRTQSVDDDLVVIAGDNLFSEPLAGFPPRRDAPVLGVYDVGDLEAIRKYNAIEIDEEGRIAFFEEKPEQPRSTLTGIALYFYPRTTLPLVAQYLSEGGNPDQPGRLVQWLYPRLPVYTWRVPGRWYDIGSHETLVEADRAFSPA
jgi:glucose-1-phosphate thymidylyltransferase